MPVTSRIAVAAARGFGLFSAIAKVTDAYFKYVTLLLPGNGTNGAQNNTFLDSSTNNFTITRNGNTTQGTFAPYGANWSNYLNGSTDYLTVPDNVAFTMGTGDFSVECWYYTSSSSRQILISQSTSAGNSVSFWMEKNASNQLRLVANVGGTDYVATATTTMSLNTWYFLQMVRSGTTIYGYQNGTQVCSVSVGSGSLLDSTDVVSIGGGTVSLPVAGYISNVRILKGVASSANTPTSPLTAISGTSLLTCQSNRFIDNSSNNFAITRNGSPSVQAFSPFAPTAAYSASTVGGSGYFDGSGDYLTAANNAAFNLGTGDFTIEGWIYPTSAGTTRALVAQFNAGGVGPGWTSYLKTTNVIEFYGGSGTITVTGTTAVKQNAWNHFAVVRNGSTITIYLDGVAGGTGTNSSFTDESTAALEIGARGSGGIPFTGYMSGLRIVKGTAVYTANFTPPTAPLTAITNTSLLLSSTNAGIIDNAMMNDLETVGNAQISTTQSKWGGSSMYFDGSGDWLYAPSSNLYSIGSGDFTVEYWLYLTANFTSAGSGMVTAAYDTNWNILGYNSGSGNIVRFYVVNSFIDSSTPITLNTWTHVAVTRSSNTARIFINGTQTGTGTLSGTGGNSALYVGTNSHNTAQTMTGYIDDLRITKGVARYTANFTPPTAAFPLQ